MPTILKPYVELMSITPNAEELLERCGRVCYKSEEKIGPGTAEKLIKMLKSKNHASVLEHAVATFFIRTDRGISHEIVRHRIASYSQESTRYCVAGGMVLKTTNYHNNPTVEEFFNIKQKSKNGSWKRFNIRQLNEKTGVLQHAKVFDVIFNGRKPTIKIITKLGYSVEVTKDHKILSESGYREAGSLRCGDKIAVNGTEKLYKNKTWMYDQYNNQMKTSVQIAEEFRFNVSCVKNWVRKHKLPKKPKSYFNLGRTAWNKGLGESDDQRVGKQAKTLRKYHWDKGNSNIVTHKRDRVVKPSARTSHKMVGDFCEVCRSLEDLQLHHIDGNRDRNDKHNHITLCRTCHCRIHSKNLMTVYYDTIVGIEDAGLQNVYDLTMIGDNHNFVANGVVVHNCNYGKTSGEISIIRPSELTDDQFHVWMTAMNAAEQAYLGLLSLGCKPQTARSVLPTCTKTDIIVTMNFRSWLHFIDMRAKSPPAHPDIAPLAQEIKRILVNRASAVFSDESTNG